MTIRCIIVDDEEMILERLERFFSKHTNEFELVGKAYSGAEGIKLAVACKPDIVLTDIVMPGMNGIEMIEHLRLKLPLSEFIIVSAYSDFTYAKQAMSMSVQEYVIKVPLSEEEILAALRRSKDKLDAQRSSQNEMQRLLRHRLDNVYYIRKQLIGELVRGNLPVNRLAGLAENMNVNPGLMDSYCCIVVEWKDIESFAKSYAPHEQGILRYAMLNVLEETIREQADGFACEWSDKRLIAVVACPNMNSAADTIARKLGIGQRLIGNLRQYLKQDVHVAVSDRYIGWQTLHTAFYEASTLCQHGFYANDSEVYIRQTIPAASPDAEEKMAVGLERMYVTLLEERPIAELLAKTERLREEIRRLRPPILSFKKAIGEFVARAYREASARNKQLGAMPRSEHLERTFDADWKVVADTIRNYLDKAPESGKLEIVRSKHYIETHLSERLTLDEVASSIGLAPTYFSALFKRENGESFVDYVNRRKIEKAAALLKEREYSNNQLCILVGIQSEKYLCKLFKDIFGIPPQKFRKSLR